MAYHMFFGFNLTPGVDPAEAGTALRRLADRLIGMGLLVSVTPVFKRSAHPVLDTAGDMPQSYFATMSFRDRTQADASVAHIHDWSDPTDSLHKSVIGLTTDQVFICFEELH